jgi:hypothetical protein
MSGPNVDQAAGVAGSPFQASVQEPLPVLSRKARVR